MIYSGFAGFATILLFAITLADVSYSNKKIKKSTLSKIASSGDVLFRIKMFILLAAICGLIFIFNIPTLLALHYLGLTYICGVIGSIAMAVLGLTLHKPSLVLHQISGFVFYICLLLLPLETGIILIQRGDLALGIFTISAVILSLALSLKSLIIKDKHKTKLHISGITEVIAMLPSAIWVIMISILLIRK